MSEVGRGRRPVVLLVVAGLVVLGALVALLFALGSGGSDDGDGNGDGGGDGSSQDAAPSEPSEGSEGSDTPAEEPDAGPVVLERPLRLLPVAATGPGPCAEARPPAVIDDPRAGTCLTLDAESGMEVRRLARPAIAEYDQNNAQWVVLVTFLDEDAARFADLTGDLATLPSPQNQLGMVLGKDRLLTAPAVTGPLTGGEVQISGGYDQAAARSLARQLGGA